MFDFEPSDEQKMLIDWVKKFSANDLRKEYREAEETGQYPEKLIGKGWEMGILQASIPEIYGGFGEHSALTGVLAIEEMAWGDFAGAINILSPGLFALPILFSGSEKQKEKYLPKIVENKWQPYSSALVEHSFDFDPGSLKTKAVEQNDCFEITGAKGYVPFGEVASSMIVYAELDGKTQGFIIDLPTKGVAVGEKEALLGLNGCSLYKMEFDHVIVPKNNRLGGVQGHDFDPILAAFRIASAAMGVGISKAAFEYSRDYAKDREVFGVKVAQKQSIAFMLAEMATEIEAIRLLVWEAAWLLDNDKEDAGKNAYLAHLGASDMAIMVTDRAVQILGGHGYIREHPVELWLRNGRGVPMLLGLAIV